MNLLADEVQALLEKRGITSDRNTPNTSVGESIRKSNSGLYDLHLALHSNASPEHLTGKLRGVDVYYYAYSRWGKAAAEALADRLKTVYPRPELVKAVPTTELSELSKTGAPAVLAELGYHDNPEDEAWLRENREQIARSIAEGVAGYFGLSLLEGTEHAKKKGPGTP